MRDPDIEGAVLESNKIGSFRTVETTLVVNVQGDRHATLGESILQVGYLSTSARVEGYIHPQIQVICGIPFKNYAICLGRHGSNQVSVGACAQAHPHSEVAFIEAIGLNNTKVAAVRSNKGGFTNCTFGNQCSTNASLFAIDEGFVAFAFSSAAGDGINPVATYEFITLRRQLKGPHRHRCCPVVPIASCGASYPPKFTR